MIRKFAAVPGFGSLAALIFFVTIVAGAAAVAQQSPAQPAPAQTPTQQQPAAQPAGNSQASDQEPAPEESTSRKPKPRDYKKWTFNVDGGASLTNGTTRTFVRSGGGIGGGGVAHNTNKYFGFRLDFQFDNLPLRANALQQAQSLSATSHMYALMLDPIINIPATKVWSGYVLFGPSWLHRSGKLDSSTATPGTGCNGFFVWWGRCYAGSLPLNGRFLTESQNEFGYNLGGGIARKIRPNVEIYAEFRYLHGKQNGITTDVRPITLGVRW